MISHPVFTRVGDVRRLCAMCIKVDELAILLNSFFDYSHEIPRPTISVVTVSHCIFEMDLS